MSKNIKKTNEQLLSTAGIIHCGTQPAIAISTHYRSTQIPSLRRDVTCRLTVAQNKRICGFHNLYWTLRAQSISPRSDRPIRVSQIRRCFFKVHYLLKTSVKFGAFLLRDAVIRLIPGLRDSDITYFSVFLTRVRELNFYRAFLSFTSDQNLRSH